VDDLGWCGPTKDTVSLLNSCSTEDPIRGIILFIMAKPIYGSWVGKEKLGNNFQKNIPKIAVVSIT
jgi:hypothetical protein